MTDVALAFALTVAAVATPARGEQTVTLKARAVAAPTPTVALEVCNVSDADLDIPVGVTITLTPLEPKKANEHDHTLFTSVDLTTGRFAGFYPKRPVLRLRLLAGQTRAFRIELEKLKWSLGPRSNWAPRELRQLAETGDYEVTVALDVLNPREHSQSGPILLRIASE